MPLADHLEIDYEAPEHQAGAVRAKRGDNRCPECGIDLTGQDPRLHSTTHWPTRWDPNNPPSAEAVRRKKALESMVIGQGREHF